MYEKSEFLDELDDNIIIWRYMTMASFLSLIIDKRLLFRKASTYKDIMTAMRYLMKNLKRT